MLLMGAPIDTLKLDGFKDRDSQLQQDTYLFNLQIHSLLIQILCFNLLSLSIPGFDEIGREFYAFALPLGDYHYFAESIAPGIA